MKFSAAGRVAAVFAALFWVLCLSLTFLPAWFSQVGLDTTQIGLILAVSAWFKVPLTLAAGSWSDRLNSRRKLLIVIVLLLAVLTPVLLLVRDFLLLCIVWGVMGALLSTCVPLTDTVGVMVVRREVSVSYGRMRLWGSVSFLVCSVAGGWLIRLWQADTTVWLIASGILALLFFVYWLPEYPSCTADSIALPIAAPRLPIVATKWYLQYLELLRQPGFVVTLLTAATLMASHAALYTLGTLHWLEMGFALPVIGALWSIGVVAEIAIFYFSARLSSCFGPWQLMLVAALVGVIRWCGTALATDLLVIFGLQILHSITFTFTQLGVINFIQREVPERSTATAQTIYDSCAIGIVFGLALYVSGWLATFHMHWAFYAMALMSAVAGVIALVHCWRSKFGQK